MNETFEQFKERLSLVAKEGEVVFGRAHQGNTRSAYDFDGYSCYLECFGFRRISNLDVRQNVTPAQMMWVASGNPHSRWILAPWVKGKSNAARLAKQYGGVAKPDEYHEDDMDAWYLVFPDGDDTDGFDLLVKFIWDHKNGKLPNALPWHNAGNKD